MVAASISTTGAHQCVPHTVHGLSRLHLNVHFPAHLESIRGGDKVANNLFNTALRPLKYLWSTISGLYNFNRQMKVVDLESREEVERMFVCWQLCEKMARPWLKPHSVSIIVSVGCAATIYIFMAVKYTNLPTLLYSAVAIMGPGFLLLLAVRMYDCVIASQLSGGVLVDQLMNLTAPGLRNLPRKMQQELMKKSKAMRPIAFAVGSFTDVQYTVMMAIWEEVLNQVLFLLSL